MLGNFMLGSGMCEATLWTEVATFLTVWQAETTAASVAAMMKRWRHMAGRERKRFNPGLA